MRDSAKRLFVGAVAALVFFAGTLALTGEIRLDGARTAVCFTPGDNCDGLIAKEIAGARKEVLVQAYGFTNKEIAAAVMEAVKRGVQVRILLDKSNRSDRYSAADFVSRAGAETHIDAAHAIAHNKVMIVDGETVITGSFNFTRAAQKRNAENVLVIRSKRLAEAYALRANMAETPYPPGN